MSHRPELMEVSHVSPGEHRVNTVPKEDLKNEKRTLPDKVRVRHTVLSCRA